MSFIFLSLISHPSLSLDTELIVFKDFREHSKSHIFDGLEVFSKIGNFQLVDIHDPLSRALIDSPEGVLAECSRDANEGWYAFDYLDQIKQVVRRKFMGLLQGVRVEDKDCDDLLGWELSKESRSREGGAKTGQRKSVGGGGRKGKGRKGSRSQSRSERSGSGSESSAVETEEGSGASEREEEENGEDSGNASGSGQSEAEAGDGEGEVVEGTLGGGGRRKPKKPVRAPWEMPKKKKRRPKLAETEEDMVRSSNLAFSDLV